MFAFDLSSGHNLILQSMPISMVITSIKGLTNDFVCMYKLDHYGATLIQKQLLILPSSPTYFISIFLP